MIKKVVILQVVQDQETGQTFLYPDVIREVTGGEKHLWKTCNWIEGRTARVQVVSDNEISLPECLRLAIAYMTGKVHVWTFDLREDEPKWSKVE